MKHKSYVFHVKTTVAVLEKVHGFWATGETECPGWAYAPNRHGVPWVQVPDVGPMFAQYDWAADGLETAPKFIIIHGVKYVFAYSSQGGLKKGVAVYIRKDVYRTLRKWELSAPGHMELTEKGKAEYTNMKKFGRALAKAKAIFAWAKSGAEKAEETLRGFAKAREEGRVSDEEWENTHSTLEETKAKALNSLEEAKSELEETETCAHMVQVGKRTTQKVIQWPSLHGTGVERTGITFDESNVMSLPDQERVDDVEGAFIIDTEYKTLRPVKQIKFTGADGILLLGSDWLDAVQNTLKDMAKEEYTDICVKFIQARVRKGIANVMPPVEAIAKSRGIPLVDGGIQQPDGKIFRNNTVGFTESTQKNKAWQEGTFEEFIKEDLVNEILATSMHFSYGKVKLCRQYSEMFLNQAEQDELNAVLRGTANDILRMGTGKGYLKEARNAIPELKEIQSMRGIELHPGTVMTVHKKAWNRAHRAAAGKVTVEGDCLIANPDYEWVIDFLCRKYGTFENQGKKAGCLGKRTVTINGEQVTVWEIKVPHAKERGLIGKIVVLGRLPYVTPYGVLAIVVGDSFSDGIIEISMQEGCPIMAILSCDFDGDHIYVIYDENIVNAVARFNALIRACGYGFVVFDDMPGEEEIKTASKQAYIKAARTLSDVGLATTPIFKLAALLPKHANPDMLITACNGEKITARMVIFAMLMVNAAVTRAADAIKRGAPNGFNETETGRMIGDWTNGIELSKIHDHCEEMLGVHTEETLQKIASRMEKKKCGWIDWSDNNVDEMAIYISQRLVGNADYITSAVQYKDVNVLSGGWITTPERGVDWVGLHWSKWTTEKPVELAVNVGEFTGDVYVDLDGKSFVSADEARAMWTAGTDVNLAGDVQINLVYSRLYRIWQKESTKASSWKRKVDLTARAREVCYSIIKAKYVAAYGLPDDKEAFNDYAHRMLYNNLGMYFMSKSVTDTTADELRDWIRVPEFNAFMLEANDAWTKSNASDPEIEERLANFENSVSSFSDIRKKIKAVAEIAAEFEDGFEGVGKAECEDADTYSLEDFDADEDEDLDDEIDEETEGDGE